MQIALSSSLVFFLLSNKRKHLKNYGVAVWLNKFSLCHKAKQLPTNSGQKILFLCIELNNFLLGLQFFYFCKMMLQRAYSQNSILCWVPCDYVKIKENIYFPCLGELNLFIKELEFDWHDLSGRWPQHLFYQSKQVRQLTFLWA